MFAFIVTVGKEASHAAQYTDGAEDVADLLVKMATGNVGVSFSRGRRESDSSCIAG